MWLLGPLVSRWICIPVVRMVLRVFPVRTDSRRLGCVTGLVAIALLYGGIFAVGITTTLARSDEERSLAVVFGAMGPFIAVTSLVLASTYLGARRASQGPSVLFLRRFSTFSDRVVVGLILRVVPRHVRVILLASPTGGPGDWDPVVVAFSGLRLLRPWRNLPLFAATDSQRWEADVARLIASATLVVVDVSDLSPSVARELELLETPEDLHKALPIVEDGVGSSAPPAFPIAATCYRRSLRAALPRIGTAATLFLLLTGFAWWMDIGGALLANYFFQPILGLSLPAEGFRELQDREGLLGVRRIALLGSLIYLVPLSVPLLFRRSLDKASREALRARVLAGLRTGAPSS